MRVCAPGGTSHAVTWKNMLTIAIVLVRRVVEARRIAAQGGPDAVPTHTQALPPLNEKRDSSKIAQGKGQGGAHKEGFWKKLMCW